MLIPSLLVFSLLLVTTSASAQDFCVADLTQSDTPAGFECEDVTQVTPNDFAFSLAMPVPGNASNIFNYSVVTATAAEFPAVNGLWLSMVRVDIAPGGVIPMHTHPRANELVIVIQGVIIVGFISSDDNIVYSKTLRKWDIFVIPQGLLHFKVNSGRVPAIVLGSFSSSNPGIQILDLALFSSSLLSEVVETTTLLDPKQVMKLKRVFNGSG